jgi:uncharacterized membrane protein
MHGRIILSNPMASWFNALKGRPVMVGALLLGVCAASALPASLRWVTRALWGWNAGVWTYLVANAWMMSRADHHKLRRNALLHAEGLVGVTAAAVCAVAASLAAIAVELSQARQAGTGLVAWPQVVFALFTIVGSWLLLPTLFGLAYASRYYESAHGTEGGLSFPGAGPQSPPGYADFMYFALTLAATSQTSDVAITRPQLRRWVAVQAVLSFAFNTMLLALAVNIAAGLI